MSFLFEGVCLIFNLIDNGDGSVTYDEFVQGICRLKGHAREIDVIAILHHVDQMQKALAKLVGAAGMQTQTLELLGCQNPAF